ncbi:hypothetical protein FAZ69_16115 [Trinickia terrae]|uniref:Uncharacterized protein n=1 Tax=Trinickia terrae TaxID=2571161 RepID=A0A4U1I3H6_9BURK|nr:hypothetical protein [Trinickia terrae]TKC87801.1 hypothetical protein FAZ69_16115 [Trinickia terrae]
MSHCQVEQDLEHLERIIARITAGDRIPLSYWRKRIQSVLAAARLPPHIERAKKLISALDALESNIKLGVQ